MSADLTAEHIDAGSGVRFALNDALDVIGADFMVRDGEPMSDIERETLAFVLTSPTPAVHAALAASLPAEVKAASMTDAEMLAALVNRGTLERETAEETVQPLERFISRWMVAP